MSQQKKAKYSKEDSCIIRNFDEYRNEMDTRNDKHERIVKMSRDITITSKRIIFNLHRILPHSLDHEAILQEADSKLHGLTASFNKIGEELAGEDVYQFHRAYTNGVQEFVEALSFYRAIRDRVIINPDDVMFYMGSCPLLHSDYIAGLADLTGEIMRMCISFCSKGDNEIGFMLRELLYQVNAGLTILETRGRGMNQKMTVMLQSLRKCELSNYTVSVRGAEFPDVVT